MLKKDHDKYIEQISSHNKNSKEHENWLEWSQIIQIREELYQNVKEITEKEDLSKQELRKLQKYLVLCLKGYILIVLYCIINFMIISQ